MSAPCASAPSTLAEARFALDIVVEEDHRVAGELAHGPVQRSSEAEVLAELQALDSREPVPRPCDRVVAGAVVDDHDSRLIFAAEARQGLQQELAAVPVRDVDHRLHRPQNSGLGA